ncbi:MAG TPA: ABC transporter ATP-binding protein [Terriglobia bacterium]|nr:ABC transporter ATP-binding protein [Terriglobia bacterium]
MAVELEDQARAGGALMQPDQLVIFDNVSKSYGEVLGVNRITLSIEPGVTSLVGPNGAGKTTLMNLMTGLLRPTKGTIRVLDVPPSDPERFYRNIGYCSQFDAFPRGLSGYHMIHSMMQLHGFRSREAEERTWNVMERVGMTDAAHRRVAGYSKGMRQRIRLALALAHDPKVLVLDEPLNGLDPMARAEVIDLFRKFAESGMHVIISSHIMHEVDIVSDSVIMLSGGYVVAEGEIQGVRHEMEEHPIQILIRCDRPALVASSVFQQDSVVEVRIHTDGGGLLVSTRNPDQFYDLLNRIILENRITVESVAPADENVNAVYQYLVGLNGAGTL